MEATWTNLIPGIAARRIGEDYEFAMRPSVEDNEETILVIFSRLREHSGNPQADVAAWWSLNGKVPPNALPLFQDRIWISAGRDRERLAGRLARFVKKQAPWAEWVEAICFATLRDWERGEPIQRLADVPVSVTLPYLIAPLLPEGEITLLYGDGESGKSLLAMFVAVAVATGATLPHMQLCGTPAPVLYLDWETNAQIAARRLQRICNGFQIAVPTQIFYRRMARGLYDDLRSTKAEADRTNAALIIIDSIAPACGGSPSKEELIVPFFNAVRSLGRTALLISHISKMEAGLSGDKATPIGSIFSRNLARQTWLMRRADSDGDSRSIFVGIFHTKSNEERRLRPFGLRFSFSENATQIGSVAPEDVPALADHLPGSVRVRALLSNGARTVQEIAADLNMAESTVRGLLARMPDAIVVERGGSHKPSRWGLKAQVNSQEEGR